MFRNSTEFVGFKAAELKEALQDIAVEKRASRKPEDFSRLDEMLMNIPTDPVVLWIDKVCGTRDRWRLEFLPVGRAFSLHVAVCPSDSPAAISTQRSMKGAPLAFKKDTHVGHKRNTLIFNPRVLQEGITLSKTPLDTNSINVSPPAVLLRSPYCCSTFDPPLLLDSANLTSSVFPLIFLNGGWSLKDTWNTFWPIATVSLYS